MRRREFIGLVGGAARGRSRCARSQANAPRVVFWLGGTPPDSEEGKQLSAAFREALRGFGWVEDVNLRIELQWVKDLPTASSMRMTAAELVSLRPDVIVTTGAPILAALQRETKTVPIVFTMVTDPVSDGFVASLARPGGNITGFTISEHSFAGKWVEMLKEMVPGCARGSDAKSRSSRLGRVSPSHRCSGAAPRRRGDAGAGTPSCRDRGCAGRVRRIRERRPCRPAQPGRHETAAVIAQAALRRRLPSIYGMSNFPADGGLMSYGISQAQAYRDAAVYVDRILRGVSPSGCRCRRRPSSR